MSAQLDKVLADCLCRAWSAGAGPGEDRLVVDVDSCVGEVYGYDKQGAGYGYTHKRGYHPIVATRSQTGEVLHIRARKGSANTSRGALRFVEELLPRVARAGATGPKLLRADSGFWNLKLMARLQTAGWTSPIRCWSQLRWRTESAEVQSLSCTHGRRTICLLMPEAKTQRVHLRVAASDDELFRGAAAAANESLSEFLVEGGRERAERLLADRTRFVLSPAQWRKFTAALDRAPRGIPELAELFRRPRPE
jgi:uncharacterized protein (DUF1778 family)